MDFQERVVKIKVIGIGGAGNNVINRMIEAGVEGVDFIVVNTLFVNKSFSTFCTKGVRKHFLPYPF